MSDAARFGPEDPKARVFILYTGGTVGMAEDATRPGSPLVPQPMHALMGQLESLSQRMGIALEARAFDEPLDSSNVGPDHWRMMARTVEEVYADFDGFVILHGTDTLAYTASALAFMFEGLGKPVVVTGSQLPISDVRTDAVLNLVNAVCIAAWPATALPCIPEVVVVFSDVVLRGCRTRKVSSTSLRGFESPNQPALGSIGEHIEIHENFIRALPSEGRAFRAVTDLSTDVLDVTLFPGFSAAHLERLLLGPSEVRAVLLRTYGAGNAPEDSDFLDLIGRVREHGKLIVSVTQCQEGMVEMGRYAASAGLRERGVVSGADMTPEAALTKLMWTLANRPLDEVVGHLQVNERGEMSENRFDLSFAGPEDPVSRLSWTAVPDPRLLVERVHAVSLRISETSVEGDGVLQISLGSPDGPPSSVLGLLTPEELMRGVLLRIDPALVRPHLRAGEITLTLEGEGLSVGFETLQLGVFSRAQR